MSNTVKISSRPKHNWWILLILGISLLIHLPFFFKPFSQAEAIQIMAVNSRPFSFYHYQPQQFAFDPPGIYYLIKGTGKLIKTSQYFDTITIASSSQQIVAYKLALLVLPNLLTLFGIYLLSSKFLNRRTSNLLCFFLAFLPLVFYSGQIILPFFWVLTCVVWSWIFLLELLGVGSDIITAKRHSFLYRVLNYIPFGYNYIFFLVFTMLGIYTSYFYFFFLLTQLLALAYYHRWTRFIVTIFFIFIVYLPWLPFINRQLQIIPAYKQIVEGLIQP